ncbi:MAG: hypothetical protein ISS72_01470 [Candidatus Brocadiae bacterium]|nr:hypothetical protein [Candidatus Brocadiia bacterium]
MNSATRIIASLVLGLSAAVFLTACGDGQTKGKDAKPSKAPAPQAAKAQETCPVMGGKVVKTIFADHDGKRVYFCCAGCVGTFKKDPAKYITKLEDAGVTLAKAEPAAKPKDKAKDPHAGHGHD